MYPWQSQHKFAEGHAQRKTQTRLVLILDARTTLDTPKQNKNRHNETLFFLKSILQETFTKTRSKNLHTRKGAVSAGCIVCIYIDLVEFGYAVIHIHTDTYVYKWMFLNKLDV